MAPNRRRGRPRGSNNRNSCVQCRVFISRSETLCGGCALQQETQEIDVASDVPDNESARSLQLIVPVMCSLCQENEVSADSLCPLCCPITLPNITSAECQKCRRIPPTELNTIRIQEIKRTTFGCFVTGRPDETVNICNECVLYSIHSQRPTWAAAWPSVILDFLTGKYNGSVNCKPFHKVLPRSIMQQYQHLLPQSTSGSEATVFDDLTSKLNDFNVLREGLSIEGVREAHNKYCFPEVRCPFGCTEFVGETGLVPFQYFLQKLDTRFKFNSINWKHQLRCVRPDWLLQYIHNADFIIKPHLYFDSVKGLCISTCRFHNGGSSKQYVHPPANPTGRLPSKFPDRLGPATITYNCYKPAKPNFSTHTYSMGIAKGNFGGISSTTISCKRRWDVAFGPDDVARESLCSNMRKDIKPHLQKLVQRRELSQELFDSITSCNTVLSPQSITNCLQYTTSVSFQPSLAVKEIQEKGVQIAYFPLFAHPYDDYGCHPSDTAINNTQHLHLWCFVIMFSLSSTFHLKFNQSTSNEEPLLKKLFSLVLCFKNKVVDTKRKQEIDSCLQNLSDDMNIDFVQKLSSLLNTISCCKNNDVNDRQNVETILMSSNNDDIVSFVNSNERSNPDVFLPDRVITQDREATYELRSITLLEGTIARTVVRHGHHFGCWWIYTSNSKVPVKVDVNDTATMAKFHSAWNSCHYELIDSEKIRESKYQYLEHLGGQGKFICEDHQCPLTVVNRKLSIMCSFIERCPRKAAWLCPVTDCRSSVCQKHFKTEILSDERIFIRATTAETNSQSSTSNITLELNQPADDHSDVSDPESETDEFSFVNFATDSGPVNDDDGLHNTDSGDAPTVCDTFDKSIPTHVLLNSDCHVLQRHSHRNERSKNNTRFLQNIVASSVGESVPLLYPDAALFPTHFFHEQKDRTITGALPAPLYNQTQSKLFNFADIEEHKKTALLNPNLLQSTDIRSLQTSFDAVFNKNLSFTDTRIVLNRGFQEVSEKKQKSISPDNTRLQFDSADSRVRVNELAALLSEEPATFFLTLTCNQKEHFGVAPLFEALERNFNRNNKEEWEKAVQAEIVLFTRAWYRSANAIMEYIEKSPEKPLGTVTKLWYRFEFQSTKGNLPHIHAVIWTKENHDELQHKVSCSGSSALFELHKIAAETNMIPIEEVSDIWHLLMSVQTHSCEKANYRCHKVIKNDGSSLCRVPRYPHSNKYSWRKVPSYHSDEALEKLHHLDLAVPSRSRDHTYDVCSILQGGKYEYPASSDEHLSPFNVLLFVLTKSSQNLQLCDDYLSARYIAKYAAGIEERADARVDPVTFRDINVHTKGIRNIKLAGVKQQNKVTDKKTLVQIIPLVESIWWLLGFNYVYSSVKFIHLSTHEKTERSTVLKNRPTAQPSASLPLHIVKNATLPPFRQYTQSQLLLFRDYQSSDYASCKISIFCGRPPPLLFVDNPRLYFTWFARCHVKKPELKITTDVNTSFWIDLFGNAVYLRKNYLNDFNEYLQRVTSEGHPSLYKFNADTSMIMLQNDRSGLKTIDDSLVQVVTSNILPSNPFKFLVHFVLSYGHFETETELFNQSNFLEVLQHSKLLPQRDAYSDQDAYTLIRKYVLSELKFLPGASRSFDRHLIASYDLFTNLVLSRDIQNFTPPLVLHRAISEEEEVKYQLFNYEKRKRCVQGSLLNNALTPLTCYQDQIVNATRQNPFQYTCNFPRAVGQSDESLEFQKRVFNNCLIKLEEFINGSQGFVKHQSFLGRPGSGKTLVCTMLFMRAIAKGLNGSITCLSGERAQQLGGEHVHKMFKFRVNRSKVPEHMASQSINALLRDVTRFTDLERLEVLFIDEVGQLNSELLCAMEIVLQHVRDNKLPMGGVFTIMSGDPKQLKPPDGSLVWLSPKLLTNYDFHYFRHYVRAIPGLLREVLTRLDETEISESEATEIAERITSACVIKSSWSDETDTFAMRVFSTRAAEQQAVLLHSQKITNDVNCTCVKLSAQDEESSTGSSIWRQASPQNSKFIDYNSITPNSVLLYKGALLRFTANIANIQARQGQLCVTLETPTEMTNTLDVMIAPPGCRKVTTFNEMLLVASGWRRVTITKTYTPVLTNKTCFLRRFTFPIKNYVASTIHKCLGDTFPKIVTKISLTDPDYKIWEKEQLLVLLSRVTKLDEITFIGNKTDIETTLSTIIQKKNCWTDFIDNFLSKLTTDNQLPGTLNLLASHFSPWNIILPEDEVGFVYLLISTKIAGVFFIGETVGLRKCLKAINSGYGPEKTRPIERRPWGLLAFVSGFTTGNLLTNARQRKFLEATLIYETSLLGLNITTESIYRLFEKSAKSFGKINQLQMSVVQCGHV